MRHYALTVSILAILFSSCAEAPHNEVGALQSPASTSTSINYGTAGIATDRLSPTIHPGDDFYQHVNGSWIEGLTIPDDKSRYGTMTTLIDQSSRRVRDIIAISASKEKPSADEGRIGNFYKAYMNLESIEAQGLAPLKATLDKIEAAVDHVDIATLMADPALGLNAPVQFFVYYDFKVSDQYAVYISQGELGLPRRDHYLDNDDRSAEVRDAYLTYLEQILTELGVSGAKERAQALLRFETALAQGYWSPVQRRDRDKMYNKVDREALQIHAPGLPWAAMLKRRGIDTQATVILREKSALQTAASVFADTNVETLRNYLRTSLISNHAAYLPERFDAAHFDLFGKILSGTQEQRPRWKRAVSQINGTVGELVGKVYVAEHFPESSKSQMTELVENLRVSFQEGIENADWMGDDTKAQAHYKLSQLGVKIGYPDNWEIYDGLQIDKDSLIGTIRSARSLEWARDRANLGRPINRDRWSMPPQRVNAYYSSVLNEIVFPAAFLDAPYFDPDADPAINYGGIGAVIGHEIGHAFDDQGRKSDGDGVQRDWWTSDDVEAYERRVSVLADQYSLYEPLPGEPLNGRLGLGENLGDLTGLSMAYSAYRRSLNGKPAPVIEGLTGDKRFFIAWAQIWAIKWREEALRTQIKRGPHSPGEFRVNGVVRNLEPWYTAFGIGPEHKMYLPPDKRTKLW